MTQVVRVSRDQVESARLLVKLSGGADKVEPIIARIAAATPAAEEHRQSAFAWMLAPSGGLELEAVAERVAGVEPPHAGISSAQVTGWPGPVQSRGQPSRSVTTNAG